MVAAQPLPSVLRLTNPVAERAILVGDPGRALELAQSLTERPLMANHQRGLWGYTGEGRDGRPLTIQSTGTGGASVAAVVRELSDAGVRRFVRAGSAIAVGSTAAGDLASVGFALAGDGTSRALGHPDGGRIEPDPALLTGLRGSTASTVGVLSVDLLPQHGGPELAPPSEIGAVDRQTAAFLAAAERAGRPAAAVLYFPAVGDDEEDARERWWRALGEVAASALVTERPTPAPTVTTSA